MTDLMTPCCQQPLTVTKEIHGDGARTYEEIVGYWCQKCGNEWNLEGDPK